MLRMFGAPYVVPEIKMGFAACKANAISTVLSLQPDLASYNSDYIETVLHCFEIINVSLIYDFFFSV